MNLRLTALLALVCGNAISAGGYRQVSAMAHETENDASATAGPARKKENHRSSVTYSCDDRARAPSGSAELGPADTLASSSRIPASTASRSDAVFSPGNAGSSSILR